MSFCKIKSLCCVLILLLGVVAAQDYTEVKHSAKFTYPKLHLKEIPKRFELKGNNIKLDFIQYVDNINELAYKQNVTVSYNIKVVVSKPEKIHKSKKRNFKIRPKKYVVPLKKNSMKLSNFEIVMKKLAEEKEQLKKFEIQMSETTKYVPQVFTTRLPPKLKFKPIISRFRSNFTKHILPVKNKIITLTV